MKTLNNSKLNKKEILEAIKKKLSDKGASKSELKILTGRFDELMVALKDHYATSIITKVEKNVIVDNLAEELAKTRDFRVANFADIKFPEFPTKMEVEMKKPDWYIDPPTAVEIKGSVKAETNDNTNALLVGISTIFGELIRFIKGFTFRTTKIDSDYAKPQTVVLYDPYSKKHIDLKSLFNIEVKGMFGGGPSSSGSGGSANTGAILDSLDHYHIADGDEVGTTKYYGFLDKDGNWYIMKNDTTANNYRYAKGSGSYSTNWTDRAALTYDYYDIIF